MRIKVKSINNAKDNEKFHLLETENCEFINPVDFFASISINSSILLQKKILNSNGFNIITDNLEKKIFQRAINEWKTEYEEYKSIQIPANLYKLLETNKKAEQIKLLKGMSLTEDELISFLFLAFEKHSYKFSQYKAQNFHKGFNIELLPDMIFKQNDGSIKTIGDTTLTVGQQKQLYEHRSVFISKFLDNSNGWHCFFLTYKSLEGKENYKNGQPHLHYISDSWNIPRNEVLKQLTNKDYHLPTLPHIDFHTHRNPK